MKIDFISYLQYLVDSLAFNIIDAITVTVAIILIIWLISLGVPSLKWSKLKENPIAIAILISVALLVFAIISASSTLAPFPPEVNNSGVEEQGLNVQE